jgi:hypothetical protein
MTPRTPQCKVFWALLLSSEHSRVPEDSQPPTFPSVGLHPHTWPKWGCDNSPTSNSTFTYLKGIKNISLMDLLFSKGVVDNHSFHKIFHSFSKVVLRTSIATWVAIVDNTELIIQVGGHTPIVVLLDTGAQLVIFGVQFAKKMRMFNSKLWKFMWQICTANGSVEEVLAESSYLIALNFDESTN